MNGKALEQLTALAVSAWPVPLFPLGFSASNPNPNRGLVTGLLGLSHAVTGRGASPEWVDSLMWSSCLGWRPPFGCAMAEIFVGYTQPCLRMVSWWLKISL